MATSYKIECWGAQGGNSPHDSNNEYFNVVYGGKGGYCSGMISLSNGLVFYIYVGQSDVGQAPISQKSFNGGGAPIGRWDYPRSGGGATDVRLTEGNTWDDFGSLKSRIIVAAGGGGAQHYVNGINGEGGYAGGLLGQNGFFVAPNGNTPYLVATGATQTSGGAGGDASHGEEYTNGHDGTFGIGGDGDSRYGGGGGGGYYGGGGGGNADDNVGSGAGGSSFISGYTGCNAIAESSTEDNIIHTGQPNHYSGYMFVHSVMIDGGSVMPSPSGGTETGHSGNGYCIITWQQLP